MNKLITLGCSLTYHGGWNIPLAELLKYELYDTSMYASSNIMQVNIFNNLLITDQIKQNDILIWQLTGQLRSGFSLIRTPNWHERLDDTPDYNDGCEYYINLPANHFDNLPRTHILSNHPLTKIHMYDWPQELEATMSTIIMSSKLFKVLVFVGWDGALTEIHDNYNKVIDLLENNEVPHIKESCLSWHIRNKLELKNDSHPLQTNGHLYAEQVLYPKLQELGWA